MIFVSLNTYILFRLTQVNLQVNVKLHNAIMDNIMIKKIIFDKMIHKKNISLTIFFAGKHFITNYSQIFCEWHLSFRHKKNFHVRETNQG